LALASKPLNPAKPRTKTRDRVLAVALNLFNERGVNAVTTAEIADAAGINEGNLYYYFQRKEQLAEALFEFLSAAMLAVADTQLANPAATARHCARLPPVCASECAP
jgi:AcrR family transcriptional regulator